MDSYSYRLHQTRRGRLLRAARRQHLIRMAAARSPKTERAYAAALLALWRSLFR